MSKPPQVMLFSDTPLFAEAFCRGLDVSSQLDFLGTFRASDASECKFVELGSRDVILLELRSSSSESIRSVRQLRERFPQCRLVLLGLNLAPDQQAAFIALGVSACVQLDADWSSLLNVIRQVSLGEPPCSAPLLNCVLERIQSLSRQPAPVGDPTCSRLSRREQTVAELISQSLTNKQIACRLSVTVATVKSHINNVLRKLDAKNRRAVARIVLNTSMCEEGTTTSVVSLS